MLLIQSVWEIRQRSEPPIVSERKSHGLTEGSTKVPHRPENRLSACRIVRFAFTFPQPL